MPNYVHDFTHQFTEYFIGGGAIGLKSHVNCEL